MQSSDYRIQTSNPSAPTSSSVVKIFADASGVLKFRKSDGAVYQVGTQYVENLSMLGQTITNTGLGVFAGGGGIAVTGIRVGGTGNSLRTMYMGYPDMFLPIVGPSGESLMLAAFLRTV